MIRTFEGGSLVRLVSNLDESFNAEQLLSKVSRGVVVFDLDGVRRVSSFGVRLWIHVVRDLKAAYWAIVRCRPAMVRQIATIQGILEGGQLLSCYVEYHCNPCSHDVERLFEVRDRPDLGAHREHCPRCDGLMSSADVRDVQAALAVSAAGPVPPLVDEMLAGQARPEREPTASRGSRCFTVVVFTPDGRELGTCDCERTGPDELQLHLPNAPLPLSSRIRLRLGGGATLDCVCDVLSGFSKGQTWVSVVRMYKPAPKFVAALGVLAGVKR